VIDDAQWRDRASAQALAFVARRLVVESVVMLFVVREPVRELAGLPELVVEGLPDSDARQLLTSVVLGRLDQRVADQLVAEARGNPLALLELPRGLAPADLAGGFGLPEALSLEGRIEDRFMQRLEALPPDTRRLLLVVAADPTGDPALVWRAAARLGLTDPAVERLADADLAEIGARVRFRHPLVRSAVYRAAGPAERRRVRAALAEATDPRVDPDRRAWHLAEATAGTDESVAGELERAAGRAQARGGLAAAAAFLERAAALTPDRVGRRSGRWRRRGRSTKLGRLTTRSRCSSPRRPAASMISSARACIFCARRSRSSCSAAVTLPGSCWRPPASSRRSTRTKRAPRISKHSRPPGSPTGSHAARTSSR
jgi:hypothetical protein